ncbi:MAG: hypothetical protein ABJA82_04595 [Myxococcales bacterium]
MNFIGPWRGTGRGIVLALVVGAVASCAAGSVRQARVEGLGAYPEARGIVVDDGGSGLEASAVAAARRALDGNFEARPAVGTPSFRLHLSVATAVTPAAPPDHAARVLSTVRSFAGLAGTGESGSRAGRLELVGALFAPDGREVGLARWEHEGAAEAVAAQAGDDTARAFASLVASGRRDFVPRRAADERLLLTPTAQTLAPGEFVISDDEVLLARVAVGLTRRLQFDFWAGGFPIPGAAGGAAAGPAIVAGGGGGVIVLGFFDLGLKLRVLDETARLPGVAISYELLDVFGLGAGGAGVVIARDAAGGLGYGVVAGANAQFNLLSVVAAKHFGSFQVTGGSYVLDNHHYLPQSAAFQGACAAGAVSPSQAGGGAIDCGSGSTRLARLPVQVQPFLGSEFVLGAHSSLMMEGFLRKSVSSTMVTTGARWLIGTDRARGLLALDRLRFRIDVAALWFYEPAQTGTQAHGARVLPLPWLGVGLYVL